MRVEDDVYELSCIATMMLPLRRTLVRFGVLLSNYREEAVMRVMRLTENY